MSCANPVLIATHRLQNSCAAYREDTTGKCRPSYLPPYFSVYFPVYLPAYPPACLSACQSVPVYIFCVRFDGPLWVWVSMWPNKPHISWHILGNFRPSPWWQSGDTWAQNPLPLPPPSWVSWYVDDPILKCGSWFACFVCACVSCVGLYILWGVNSHPYWLCKACFNFFSP